MNELGKSDRPIAPGKSPNKARAPVAEDHRGIPKSCHRDRTELVRRMRRSTSRNQSPGTLRRIW